MARRRLDSWKEIASYLKRDVTTVRRWEKREGLPVHRHVHDKLGSVYAFSDEIDTWTERRRLAGSMITNGVDPITTDFSHYGRDTGPIALTDSPPPPPAEAPPPQTRWTWVVPLALLCVLAVVMTAMNSRGPGGAPGLPPLDVAIVPPEGVTVTSLALSPAGDQIVFSGFRYGEPSRLWIRRLDSIHAIDLPDSEGASFPFWSSDGRSVGFFAGGKLRTIALGTREVRTLTDAPNGRGGSWSEHDVILFAPDDDGPIVRIAAQGGVAVPVTTVEPAESEGHAWPEFLPGGQRFLYFDQRPSKHGIYAFDLVSGTTKHVIEAYSSGSYTSDGYLLFVRDHLVARKFDATMLQFAGDPVVVANRVFSHFGWNHKADFSASRNGLLAVRYGEDGHSGLSWVDRAGRELGSLADADYSNPAIAPDGTLAVVTAYAHAPQPSSSLSRVDLRTLQATRITSGSMFDVTPLWSPVGDRLIYLSSRRDRMEHLERSPWPGGDEVRWPAAPPAQVDGVALRFLMPESWTHDGAYVTYSAVHPQTKSDVWLLNVHAGSRLLPLFTGKHNELQSQVSPDGRHIAYASDESGQLEVYVQSFPVPSRKWRVSTAGGADPRWRGDGQELFYLAADRRMMAVDVVPGAVPRYATPRPLFQTHVKYLWQDTRNHYDVTPDGQRFLLLVPHDDPRSAAYTLIFNWRTALVARTTNGSGGM
jgi:Tol biopolymer transport system component